MLRDTDSHNVHVQESLDNTAAVSVSGVKRGCILNTLRYFHVTKNVAPDIMHDMLEGVIPMEVKLVLYTFIYDDKFFKLDTLNNLLSSHNYGHYDKKNKPSQILESTLKGKDHSLKQHASQMWCLVRVLPLLIGSFIPQNNPYWDLILKLRTIVDIAFADSVTESLTLYLKHPIEDHHLLFQHLYPTVRLLPKHHFLVHYPEAMREVGPLINSWCMRFEAKHNFTKKLASVINCFKDVCLTAASRHQINACCKWQQRSLGSFELEASETENYRVSNLENYPALLEQVPGLLPEDDVFMTKKITYWGTVYKAGTTVVVGMNDELPQFGQIAATIIVGKTVVFTGNLWKTNFFDEHIHSYVIRESNEVFFLKPNMQNFHPCTLTGKEINT